MGKAFFARGGHRSYTGKSRCIPTIRRDTSGLTHATRILSCDEALAENVTTKEKGKKKESERRFDLVHKKAFYGPHSPQGRVDWPPSATGFAVGSHRQRTY